ncbi:hypothetical protein PUNSTDRAFT_18065, partial [Punctularia strigosozonata HHB-11173 SS5]|uniref:uncharacterized protein n=1 Tax=Punctularia strigosozonata (strain HHB-11173) TaxID=741275 RepID=UPI000441811F
KPVELESALARPMNLAYYRPGSTPAQQAASLAFGIIMNHPFVDGNKRTAFWAAHEYLIATTGNGFTRQHLSAASSNALMEIIGNAHEAIATGTMEESQLAEVYARI